MRPELTPAAARVARRYPRTKLRLDFLTLRTDGYFWSEGKDVRRTVLVR